MNGSANIATFIQLMPVTVEFPGAKAR
jgi:hypothetical protein